MRISSNNSFCFQSKNVSHTEANDALHEEANAGKILKVLWFFYVGNEKFFSVDIKNSDG